MSGNDVTGAREPMALHPWALIGAGLATLGAGWLAGAVVGELVVPRVALVVAGLVLAYAGVVRRLRVAGGDFPARVESAAMVSVAGLGGFLGYAAMGPWASARIFFFGVFVLSLVGATLLVLPGAARRAAVSLIILFHFAGIVTAVTNIDPPYATAPWLSRQLMAHVYRPYLNFLYMTNAYHFYSPEPGNPSVFWFAVHYSDGKYAWIRVPEKADSPIGMHYQRVLTLPEHSFNPLTQLPPGEAQLQSVPEEQRPARGSWEEIYRRRQVGSTRDYEPNHKPIPMVSDLNAYVQYQQPDETSQLQLASVARHVFRMAAARRDDAAIRTVKVYRVKINTLSPYDLSRGVSPADRTRTMPYFLGEYDAEGKIVHSRDPFLYWYLPILKVPSNYPHAGALTRDGVPHVAVSVEGPKDGVLLDCMEMHAATPSPEAK